MNWKRATIATGLLLPVIGLLAFGLTRDPKAIDSPLPGTVVGWNTETRRSASA